MDSDALVTDGILAVPMNAQAWTVWADGAVMGPYQVAAMSQVVSKEYQYPVELKRKILEGGPGLEEGAESRLKTALEFGPMYFLVLLPSPLDGNTRWVEDKHVCFTKEAADEMGKEYAETFAKTKKGK